MNGRTKNNVAENKDSLPSEQKDTKWYQAPEIKNAAKGAAFGGWFGAITAQSFFIFNDLNDFSVKGNPIIHCMRSNKNNIIGGMVGAVSFATLGYYGTRLFHQKVAASKNLDVTKDVGTPKPKKP